MFWFSKAILRVAGVLLETRGIIPEQAIEKGLNRHRAKYIFFRFVSLFFVFQPESTDDWNDRIDGSEQYLKPGRNQCYIACATQPIIS